MRNVILIFLSVFFSCTSCSGQQKSNVQIEQRKERTFTLPEVPAMLDTPEARAVFVCEHFWDNFDFADTAYIHLPDITEQAIVNFMDLMPRVPKELANKSMSILFQKAAPYSQMLWHFWETMSRYWHNPNSPMKNEEMFILMCGSVETQPQVELALKHRAQYARTLAEKNREGMKAADFTYTLESGKQGNLYSLKAEYTLVFFYDPDCETCTETKRMMKQSLLLKNMVDKGQMKVLTVYPDENVALWKERLFELENKWINAYDKSLVITHELLYDLSSIPSFYLLDKDKKVLLKDADWREITQFFEK
jgi:thioredoxin-related protein